MTGTTSTGRTGFAGRPDWRRGWATVSAIAVTSLGMLLGAGAEAIAQASYRLTPDDCDRFDVEMTEAELEATMEDMDIDPDREITAAGNGLWRWIDEESGAVLLAVLRGGRVAQLSCFGVNPPDPEAGAMGHRLCAQTEMGMTLPEVRAAIGSPGTEVETDDSRAQGLLWQWEDPERNERAILAFSSFGVLSSRTCLIAQPESEQPASEPPQPDAADDTTPENARPEGAIEGAEILPVDGLPLEEESADDEETGDR